MVRPAIAFDIETVGQEWDELDPRTREYLVGRATRRLGAEEGPSGAAEAMARDVLGLSAGTGRVIVISMVNLESDQGAVLYESAPGPGGEAPQSGWLTTAEHQTRVYRGDEKGILCEFWRLLDNYGRSITYHGRQFDVPFLYLRSALYGIRPSRQLLGNRYSLAVHCDLAEVLTFFGASHERFSLDFWCRRFGIESPKEGGVDGSQVGEMYRHGRIDEIAEYCLRDARATADLYRVLEPTLVDLYAGR